ncbi:hypothetical protein DND90_21580 [Pseudomonas syringae pv. maculicola]|nr:hypothetical protein DND90_21580 [Pseudomonas syringae pv. maculicola]
MGCVSSVSATTFPKQGAYAGSRVRVCFNYETSASVFGVIVRDDAEAPGVMIIRLDDSRHVLSTECQWQPLIQ